MNKTFLLLATFTLTTSASAQTGSANEPVTYVGGEMCNPRLHEGGFSYAIGTENIQVTRAYRTHPELCEDYGWTYNHQPYITYWHGRFYVEYLSNPKDEQQPPCHTLVATSADGRHWSKPFVVFPEYKAPEGVTIPKPYYGYIMHLRMGFYTAPNGRLLVCGFYGHSYDPFKKGGIGRVVREMHEDWTMGLIYFIRYSSHAQWNESNTAYPFYTRSKDKGFHEACKSLLKDKLRTLQWIDEDRGLDGFYTLKDSINRVQATCYYHRPDGKTVALWKWSYAALSPDNGMSWSTPVRCPSLIMAGGKQWGQRTPDGRYALAFNPIETQPYRYPLIVMTSGDGMAFDSIGIVHGEVPPRRFMGENKDFGPCYVRGITEGEATPPGNDLWLTYSVNKEDIWVSRTQLPIKTTWTGIVNDDFDDIKPGAAIPDWNIYRPTWCPVTVDENHCLSLQDEDPYDHARAIRVFEEGTQATINFDLQVAEEHNEPFQVDVTDRHGSRFLSLSLLGGNIEACGKHIGNYTVGQWTHLNIAINGDKIMINGKEASPLHAVKAVSRLSLRTGEWRNLPDRNTPNQTRQPPLPGCDDKAPRAAYLIDNVRIK